MLSLGEVSCFTKQVMDFLEQSPNSAVLSIEALAQRLTATLESPRVMPAWIVASALIDAAERGLLSDELLAHRAKAYGAAWEAHLASVSTHPSSQRPDTST